MFDVNGVNLHFGERQVLRDATFKVDDGERAAIIGPNGAGKSTLLKIVAGLLSAESGNVSYPKTTEIGYLPQDIIIESALSVEEECRTVFQEVLDHEQEMRDIEHRLGEMANHDTEEYHQLADRYDYLLHETMRRDIYSMDSNIAKVMSGLGFKSTDLRRPCREFSGGWQMRIALGKLLLANPDILLLDEPTNHLDIESIEWLGDWLANHEGSVLMVSHERAFMDKLVNKVVEIDRGAVVIYRGNYTESLAKRAERREMQRRAYENQQIELQQIQKFIDRFRYQASKAALVQSRIKSLDKMVIVEPPSEDETTIHFQFPAAPRGGKEVIVGHNLCKSFGKNHVLENVDFALYRGEKVALVGVNGAGKSTLMKVLAQKLDPDKGKLLLGSNIQPDYFAQYDYEDLHPNNTVLGEFLSAAPLSVSDRARGILGAFLFRGDDVDKKISVLSGGERTRLRLARMLCGSANLLMLDEPTNHLDIGSRLTLENALRQYDGAVILVSHDRYFLDNVVTRIVEIADGKATSYPGNYSDYLRLKALVAANPAAATNGVAIPLPEKKPASTPKPLNGTGPTLSREDRKTLEKEARKLRKRAEELEDTIADLDSRVRELENAMAQPSNASNAAKLASLQQQLNESRALQGVAESEWADSQARAEEIEEQLEGTAV